MFVAIIASAFTFYNIVPCVVGHEETQAARMAEYRAETGNDIVLYCLSVAPAIAPAEAKAKREVESWLKFAEACRRIDPGLKPGVLFQSLIGHNSLFAVTPNGPRDPFTRAVDAYSAFKNGESRWCWADPKYRAYLTDIVRGVAKGRPAFVLTDDDCAARRECFCAIHAAEYNKATGKNLTGAEWRDLLFTLPPSDPTYRTVHNLIRDEIDGISRLVRAALDETDPTIPAGICEAGEEFYYSDSHARAIAAKGQRPVCRISTGNYCEQTRYPYGYQSNFCRTSVLAAIHDGTADLLDESDTFPHHLWSRSTVGWHQHFVQAIMHGLKGAKIWFVNAWRPQQGDVPKGYTRTLATNRRFYQELARAVAASRPVGVVTPVADCEKDYHFLKWGWQNFPVDEHTWACATFTHLGVPTFASRDLGMKAIYELGGSNSVMRLSDAELRKILSGRVLVDGNAARVLAARGFSDLIGVDVGATKPFTFEAYTGTRETCGILKDRYGVPGFTLRPGAEAFTYVRYGVFHEDGDYQWYPDNEKASVVSPGTVFFKNRLGGLVATTVLTDDVDPSFRFSHARKTWLNRILARLNGGTVPDFTVLNDQDFATLVRKADDGSHLVAAFNFNLEPVETLELSLAAKPARVERLDADGVWRAVAATHGGGLLSVDASMPSWGVAVFRIPLVGSSR